MSETGIRGKRDLPKDAQATVRTTFVDKPHGRIWTTVVTITRGQLIAAMARCTSEDPKVAYQTAYDQAVAKLNS